MALLTPQTVTKAGIAPAYTTVNATDTIALAPGAVQFLHVKNGNAAACTVTIVDAGTTPAGSAATNPTVTVPLSTGDRMIGPLKNSFADQTTGVISVTYSIQTTVTAALISVPLS
jgi:hypothetical protein